MCSITAQLSNDASNATHRAVDVVNSFMNCLYKNWRDKEGGSVEESKAISKSCSCDSFCTKWNYFEAINKNNQGNGCSPINFDSSPCFLSNSQINSTQNQLLHDPVYGWYCNSTINAIYEHHCISLTNSDYCPSVANYSDIDPMALGIIIAIVILLILVGAYLCKPIPSKKQIANVSNLSSKSRSSASSQKNSLRKLELQNSLRSTSSGSKLHKPGMTMMGFSSKKKKQKPMRKLSSWFRMNAAYSRPRQDQVPPNAVPQPEILVHSRNLSKSSFDGSTHGGSSRSLADIARKASKSTQDDQDGVENVDELAIARSNTTSKYILTIEEEDIKHIENHDTIPSSSAEIVPIGMDNTESQKNLAPSSDT